MAKRRIVKNAIQLIAAELRVTFKAKNINVLLGRSNEHCNSIPCGGPRCNPETSTHCPSETSQSVRLVNNNASVPSELTRTSDSMAAEAVCVPGAKEPS